MLRKQFQRMLAALGRGQANCDVVQFPAFVAALGVVVPRLLGLAQLFQRPHLGIGLDQRLPEVLDLAGQRRSLFGQRSLGRGQFALVALHVTEPLHVERPWLRSLPPVRRRAGEIAAQRLDLRGEQRIRFKQLGQFDTALVAHLAP